MRYGYIYLTIVVLVILAGIVYVYVEYEKPFQDSINKYANISVQARYGNEIIETGYNIYLNSDDNLARTEKTSKRGYVLDKVLINQTFYIENYNLNNQTFYARQVKYLFEDNETKQIIINLEKPTPLIIEQAGKLGIDPIINLTLSTKDLYEHVDFCVEYNGQIMNVNILHNFTKTTSFKCYHNDIILNATNNILVQFDYLIFDKYSKKDTIIFKFKDNNLNRTIDYKILN